jgi:hypothetical protein
VKNIEPNSNERDLVLIVSIHKTIDFIPWIQTLRTTGCRATVVWLVDSKVKQKLDENFRLFLQDAGVNVFVWGEIPPMSDFDLMVLRWKYFASFLLGHEDDFDRVVLSDGDVIFQGDPFSNAINWSNISMSAEIVTWRTVFYRNQLRFINPGAYFQGNVINCGFAAGKSRDILKHLMLFWDEWMKLKVGIKLRLKVVPDQVFFNYMYYSKNLNYNLIPAGGIYTVLWGVWTRPGLNWEIGKWTLENDKPPSLPVASSVSCRGMSFII